MRIAYLVNTYPKPSLSFIRREIQALERQGFEVRRFALRSDRDGLIDPADVAECGRTEFVLAKGGARIAAATLAAVLAGAHGAAAGILAVFLVAVGLEAFAGFCLGCWMYAKLQGAGVIADDSCTECANIWART